VIDLEGLKVLVVGLGASGEAAARAATGLGAGVTVVDSSASPLKAESAQEMKSLGVNVLLGVDIPEDMGLFDLVVASPGVPDRSGVLTEARARGRKVISELELGYRLLDGHTFLAVTGTNGKTTTTSLLGKMLTDAGVRAVTCGNIGDPVVGLYGRVSPDAVLVAEVSSFQLQNIEEFRPRVGVVLNVAPDHFDWHRDMNEYISAKARMVENMEGEDSLAYNLQDRACVDIAGKASCRLLGFGLTRQEGSAVWLDGNWMISGGALPGARVLDVSKLKVKGAHNVLNVMAAVAASLALGIDPAEAGASACRFEGLEHRLEYVDDIAGVSYFNDSKATNPHAALNAIRTFHEPLVVIMGGRNKGLEFTDLAREACALLEKGEMKGIVLVGESSPEIRAALEEQCGGFGTGQIVEACDLEDALNKAHVLAGGEGTVLYTPACASFDMFRDYAERGRAFKESVRRFKGSVCDAGRG
jgi:UDP-N-acetylmuramoylalanine--D-glutamate ligase